ncbi:CU044_5270 family protein [Leifsonia kafniensis]
MDKAISGARTRTIAKTKARRRTTWTLGLTGVAAALAVGLVVTDVVGIAGLRPGASAAAAEVLNSAAQAAIATSDPVVGPSQYLRIKTDAVFGGTLGKDDGTLVTFLASNTDTLYIPGDSNRNWVWDRSARKPVKFFGNLTEEEQADTWKSLNADGFQGQELLDARNGAFYGSDAIDTPESLAKLSRDPRILLNHIYRINIGAGRSVDGQALVHIADILRTGLATADLRAALYKAAAMIPGVTVTEQQVTLDGRSGIAIGRTEDADHTRQDIIIDPANGLVIGEREVLLESANGFPAGTNLSSTAVTTTVADSVPTAASK